MARLVGAFKRWRAKQREYQIQRAFYKQGGGAGPPSKEAMEVQWVPPTITKD